MSKHFDLIDLSTEVISDEQAGNLEIEMTPEIYAALRQYQRENQNKLVEEEIWNDDPVYQPGIYRYDMEQDLSLVVDLQDRMQTTSQVQFEMRKDAVHDMNDWYTRFNTWLRKDPNNRRDQRVWDVFKKGLAKRKTAVQQITRSAKYQALRDSWAELDKTCRKVVRNKEWLWQHYFDLKDLDLGPYFAGWDPEEIDDQQVLKQGQGEVADVLGDMHVIEQIAFRKDSQYSTGSLWGFWSQQNSIDVLKQNWANRYHGIPEATQL